MSLYEGAKTKVRFAIVGDVITGSAREGLKKEILYADDFVLVGDTVQDPCGVCGKRVIANSVLCTKCMKWIHGRCAKVKRVTSCLATNFVCVCCMRIMEEVVEPMESFYDGKETAKGLGLLFG